MARKSVSRKSKTSRRTTRNKSTRRMSSRKTLLRRTMGKKSTRRTSLRKKTTRRMRKSSRTPRKSPKKKSPRKLPKKKSPKKSPKKKSPKKSPKNTKKLSDAVSGRLHTIGRNLIKEISRVCNSQFHIREVSDLTCAHIDEACEFISPLFNPTNKALSKTHDALKELAMDLIESLMREGLSKSSSICLTNRIVECFLLFINKKSLSVKNIENNINSSEELTELIEQITKY